MSVCLIATVLFIHAVLWHSQSRVELILNTFSFICEFICILSDSHLQVSTTKKPPSKQLHFNKT